MNAELVVIANQPSRGEYVLGSCTQNKCALGSLVSKMVKIHFNSQNGRDNTGDRCLGGPATKNSLILKQIFDSFGVYGGRILKNLIRMFGIVY